MNTPSRSVPSPQDPAAVAALKNLKDKVQSGIQKYRGATVDSRPQRAPHMNDFARVARRLCGKSVGLILGGGGARGLSHIVEFFQLLMPTSVEAIKLGFHPSTRGVWDRYRPHWGCVRTTVFP